jgi:peroxin-19
VTKPSPDVLDEFNAQPKPAPSSSKPQQPPPLPQHAGGLPKDDELAAQLQAGMADLMGELDSNPEMQREFEKMMAELVQAGQAATDAEAIEHIGKATEAVNLGGGAGGAGGDGLAAGIAAAAASSSSGGDAGKKSASSTAQQQQQESFQSTIRKTMERMQASDTSTSAHTAAAASSTAEDDMMAQLMKELQSGGGMGGGEEDFNKMLMGMMAQLTNKDILYEPMKELHDKFPAWMEKNKATTGKEDLARFEEQHQLVKEIVGRFERKGYSDEDEDDREYIVERMQKVCLFSFGTAG